MEQDETYRGGPVDLDFALSAKLPTLRAAYSDRTAALMAAMCQNAYVPFEVLKKRRKRGTPLKQDPAGEEALRAALAKGNFTLSHMVNADDVQAFLACREDIAVLVFRGTATLRDWRTDLNQGLVKLPQYRDVHIHRGFWKAFQAVHAEIDAAISEHVPSDLPLYITGHSLGGALAQIASAVLERDNLAACYTFGSPRVATLKFDREVKCPHYRIVNAWDLVPGLPAPFLRYRHTGDPRLLAAKGSGQDALRRDRLLLASFWVNLVSMIRAFFSRHLTIVDDHMIWNYRRELDAIAKARNTPQADAKSQD